jgi:hypothetical protein
MQRSSSVPDQPLFLILRFIHKMKIIAPVCVLLTLLLFSCRKEKTTWASNWSVPLVNDTLDLSNQINDSTLSVNASNLLEVDLTRTVLDLGIEDFLELPDTTIEQSFNSSVGAINVPPGFTIVNQIEEHTLDLEDAQLKKIRLTEGQIKFTVYNPVPTRCDFTVKLPGVTQNGVDLEQQFSVPASQGTTPGSMTSMIDLSGYQIDLTGIIGASYNVLQSMLVVTSDPNGPSVTVTSTQEFKIEAAFQHVRLDYARGYFGNRVISDTTSFDLEPLKNLLSGSLDLPAPNLEIDLVNGVKIGARATILSLSNTNASGNSISLSGSSLGTPFYLNEPTGNWGTLQPTVTTLEFNGSNSSIESYLENLGSTHQLGYKLELNPWGNVSGGYNEIFPQSRLKVKVRAQMPLSIGADGLTLQDTFDLNLEQSVDKTHIGSGSFILNASNSFPISTGITLFLLDENGSLLHTVVGTELIASGTLGTYDVYSGLYKKDSELIYTLTEPMLKDIGKVKKVAVRAIFNTPDNSGANIQTSIAARSFLAVKLKTRFVLNTVY